MKVSDWESLGNKRRWWTMMRVDSHLHTHYSCIFLWKFFPSFFYPSLPSFLFFLLITIWRKEGGWNVSKNWWGWKGNGWKSWRFFLQFVNQEESERRERERRNSVRERKRNQSKLHFQKCSFSSESKLRNEYEYIYFSSSIFLSIKKKLFILLLISVSISFSQMSSLNSLPPSPLSLFLRRFSPLFPFCLCSWRGGEKHHETNDGRSEKMKLYLIQTFSISLSLSLLSYFLWIF